MSIKTRGEGLVSSTATEWHDECGVITVASAQPLFTNGWKETSAGVDIPSFHKVKAEAARECRIIPATEWYQEYLTATGRFDWDLNQVARPCNRYYANYNGVADDAMPAMVGVVLPDNSELLYDEAVQALYTDGWDILTFGLQFRQSVESFVHLGKRIHRLWTGGKLTPRDMGNTISEMAWSWRPLLYDIEDFAGLVTSLLEPKKDGCHVWRKNASLSTTDVVETSVPVYRSTWNSIVHTKWEYTFSERVSIHSMIAPPRVLVDPLVSGWELIPFSFVLDKVVNVGAMLASIGGRVWHHDAAFAYGTQLNITCERTETYASAGMFQGSYLSSETFFKQVTTRQPIATASELPQLVPRGLKIDNLRYYIELMRTIRGRKTL
jgi:hypothetical protein